MMQLTEQQLRYFATFGFLKFPGLFADQINAISDAFEQTWADIVAKDSGTAHDHKRRSMFIPFGDRSERLSSLIDDPRIEGIVSSVLGDDFNYLSSDGNYYVGDTMWHSDRCDERWGSDRREGKKHPTVKIAFYLDPLTRDTGCLRVIPGSHNPGDKFAESAHRGTSVSSSYTPSGIDRVEEVMRRAEEEQRRVEEEQKRVEGQWGIVGSEVPAFALEVEPGDLLMFDMCIKHASFGGSTRRRMFTYGFEKRCSEADLPDLREYLEVHKTEWYGEKMLSTAGPARMRHLEQRLAVVEAIRSSVAGVESA